MGREIGRVFSSMVTRKTTTTMMMMGLALLWGSCCSAALTEGGPSGFGYDASSSCSKPLSRAGRARLELPCDLSRENWCTIAGNAYPWQAVRRFVQENQGLMRRMYGDEKHISVLKSELEKNDVEIEMEGDNNYYYYDDPSANSLYRQFEVDYEFDREEGDNKLRSRNAYGRSLNIGTSGKYEDTSSAKPTTHPNETPTVGTGSTSSSSSSSPTTTTTTTTTAADAASTTASPTTTTPTTTTTTGNTTTTSTSTTSTSRSPSTPTTSHRMKITTASATTPTTTTTTTTSTSTTTDRATNNDTDFPLTSSSTTTSRTTSTTSKTGPPLVITLEQIANVQNLSINEIHTSGQIDRFDENVDELTEITGGLDTTLQPNSSTFYSDGSGGEDERYSGAVMEDAETSESQYQPQQFRPRPEYRPSSDAMKPEVISPTLSIVGNNNGASGSMEGQLYQDVAAKDKQEPVLKVRGINACPVKEEVVAPFWANNTRGEVLALLNLYPFEQYVHWEKCTHENKQMYCRDGCRCEQQYRLHRLLAYDPNNECRGIFSDWFKFPSCCICRCYDLPLEFRVTSRSPRYSSQQQHRKLKVRAPRKPPRQRRH